MPKKIQDKLNLNSEKDVGRSKFIVYGEEMLERVVKLSGNSGRIYLPPNWVGCRVKIIRVK
jgi:putative transposon-encoded protein